MVQHPVVVVSLLWVAGYTLGKHWYLRRQRKHDERRQQWQAAEGSDISEVPECMKPDDLIIVAN